MIHLATIIALDQALTTVWLAVGRSFETCHLGNAFSLALLAQSQLKLLIRSFSQGYSITVEV